MIPELDRSLEAQARLIAELPVAIALFDRDRRYVAASPGWVDAFRLARVRLGGRRHDEICRIGRVQLNHVQRRALAGESVEHCPVPAGDSPRASPATFSAEPHRDSDGAITGAIVVLQTVEKPAAAELLAGHADGVADPLTGLAQRAEFASRLHDALANPDPRRRTVLVLAIKLDSLRRINNLHGFATGDEVMKIVAERLLTGTRSRVADEAGAPVRGRNLVARLGAGEFGIICGPPAHRPAAAESLASRLLRVVQSPIALGQRLLRLDASIGYVVAGPTHREADDVLRDLDLALQQARASGPGKVLAWEPSLTRAAAHNDTLAEQLRQALENGEFLVHYQPIVRLADNRMVGAEALLRWNHPSEGLVPAASFLPVLEETGLIAEAGCWLLHEAVRQVQSWRTLYGRSIVEWVGIPLSRRQLHDPSALLATLRSLHAGRFPVHRLKLEIAETLLMGRPDIADTVLEELRALGIGFAIDDFGTGAGPRDTLRRHPADTIEINAAFVAQIGTPSGEKVLRAVLEFAHASGAVLVAKGVETVAQREFLRDAGCELGHGYLVAEPMEGAQLGVYALTRAIHAEGAQSDISRSVTDMVMRRGA